MRAKIMLLTASQRDETVADWAEQVLTDLSAAFGHAFSVMREKLEEEVSDQTADACLQCQAIFACDGEAPGMQALYDALDMPLRIRSFCVPEAVCGRHEAPVSLYVGSALSLDEETLRRALRCAFLFSQEMDCRLCAVAPNGAAREEWEAAVRVQEAAFPEVSAAQMAAPEAVAAMIASPERLGLMLCPPYAGSILLSAGGALSAHPELLHDMALDGETGVFAPFFPSYAERDLPFACALALAQMLRFSLHLHREAACLEAAVGNVLAASGQSGDAEGDMDPLRRICEQIAVAGELMSRSGIG